MYNIGGKTICLFDVVKNKQKWQGYSTGQKK